MRQRLRAAGSATACLALTLALVAAACGGDAGVVATSGPTYPLTSARPPEATSAVVQSTRAELARVLGQRSLMLQDPQVAFRPAEGPALASAPRAVYQVVLPDDPTKGYLVVYELPDVPMAAAAGADQAAYLASGPGRVQTPSGTRHIIRQLGPTLILYSWIPEGSTDERAPLIGEALETIGIPVPVPG